MGDYAYARGTARIRPIYTKPLQQVFETRNHPDNDGDVKWALLGELCPELGVLAAYQMLVHGDQGGRMPMGMSNPAGWPFDDEDGDVGDVQLRDDGMMLFRCSNRNRENVIEAWVCLLAAISDEMQVEVDRNEFQFSLEGDYEPSQYTRDSENLNGILDDVVLRNRKRVMTEYVRTHMAVTHDERALLIAAGVGADFIESLKGSTKNIVNVPTEDGAVKVWSDLVRSKLERCHIPYDQFKQGSPHTHETLADYCVRLAIRGMAMAQPDVRKTSLNSMAHYDTIIDRIEAHKLFNRGKLGVRQIKRKQRRKARA